MGKVINLTHEAPADLSRLEEIETFGEIGGLALRLIREQGDASGPLHLVLMSGKEETTTIQSFQPEGCELARIVAMVTLRALEAAHFKWVERPS